MAQGDTRAAPRHPDGGGPGRYRAVFRLHYPDRLGAGRRHAFTGTRSTVDRRKDDRPLGSLIDRLMNSGGRRHSWPDYPSIRRSPLYSKGGVAPKGGSESG